MKLFGHYVPRIILRFGLCIIMLNAKSAQTYVSTRESNVFLPPIGLPPLTQWRLNGSTHHIPNLLPSQQSLIFRNFQLPSQTSAQTESPVVTSASSVEQSRPCTPEENLKQIQCLRELPAERYEVLEGEDIQMRCRVAHQRGKAQWRAGNFLLGHIRSIPGWKRYSLHGDPRLGIHDLVIQNVSSQDAGTFECQVSPADGHAPLRRQTTLSILAKPTQPIIVTPAGEPQPSPDGQLIVPMLWFNSSGDTTQEQLILICQSKGGNPEPTFEWFHNGKPVSDHQPRQALYNEDGQQAQRLQHVNSFYSESNNEDSANREHHSELILNKEDLKTGDRVVCLVSNKATLRSIKLSQQKLRSELIIVIHVAPGIPEIIDWAHKPNRSQIFNSGASLEATCRSVPAGTPSGELIWRLEKQNRADELRNLVTPSVPHLFTTIPSEYIVQQYTEDKLLSKVTIPQVNASYHGLELVCAVRHPVGPERNARVSILVRHSPKHVYIDGPTETVMKLQELLHSRLAMFNRGELPLLNGSRRNFAHVYLDRPQYFLCFTSPYFDHASVKWFGYLNITGRWDELTTLDEFSHPLETQTSNYIHASFVQLVSTNAEKSVLSWTAVKCVSEPIIGHGEDTLRETVFKQIDLNPYEPPGKPIITGYNQANLLPEGTNITLRCEADGGTPTGRLVWLSNLDKPDELAEQLKTSATFQEERGRIWSIMKFTLKKEYNGILLRCGAQNEGYRLSDRQTSSPVLLAVAFSATSINLTVSDESGRLLFPRDSSLWTTTSSSDQSVHFVSSVQPPTVTADSGMTISVTCQVDQSNPPPRILWRLSKRSNIFLNKTDALLFQKDILEERCEKQLLKDQENAIVTESVVRSRVNMKLNWTHHGSMLECFTQPMPDHLFNALDSSTELAQASQSIVRRQTMSKHVLLNVRFAPTFIRQAEQLKWSASEDQDENGQATLPQYITNEGGSVELEIKPIANPDVEKLVWFKNHESLHFEEKPGDNTRLTIHESRLQINPVHATDMANYTVLATNAVGRKAFRFFLNVTYGPQIIGPTVMNITASGLKAQLDCEAIGNPIPIENAVRWRRLPHRLVDSDPWSIFYAQPHNLSESLKQQDKQTDMVVGIRCNKGKWQTGSKHFVKCWSPRSGVLTSSLTIYDLNPNDVGRYQCHMDNAVGSPAVKIVDLIYPFAPRIIPIPRWSKAAPNGILLGSSNNVSANEQSNEQRAVQAKLTCVVAAEPVPAVEWMREPANLTLVEGGQFRLELKNLHPALYQAILHINQPKTTDIGRYFCKVSNVVGLATGLVELIEASRPDQPSTPRLLNATSTSLSVSWTQGYNGGPKQTFQLRWALNDNPTEYKQIDIPEEFESETVVYTIKDLEKATTYRVSVSAANELFGSTGFTPYILASTKAHDPLPDNEAMRDEARAKSSLGFGRGQWNTNSLAEQQVSNSGKIKSGSTDSRSEDKAGSIIVAASIFGSIVLVANLLIVLLLAHRKRKKMRQLRKGSIISGVDSLKLRSTGPSFTDMGGIHQTSYATYTDGASLTGEVRMQGRSIGQYSPFNSEFGQITTNMSPIEQMNYFNQPYASSPQPSLQAVNPLILPVSNQFEYSSLGATCANHMTESDLTGLTYLNRDASFPFLDSQHHPLSFEEQSVELLRSPNSAGIMERRTPLSARMNPGLGLYQPVHRVESPQSGPNSCISNPGFPHTNSLERNSYNLWSHTPSIQHGHPIVRQSSFGHSNGNFVKNPPDYGMHYNPGISSVGAHSPNQTLWNYRQRQNLMSSSYYADRGFGPLTNYPGNMDRDDAVLGNSGVYRKGLHNRYKYHDILMMPETHPMTNVYLQRYNDQLQSLRAMNRQLAASKSEDELEKAYGVSKAKPIEQHPTNDGFLIPPPNAFGTHAGRQLSPQSPRPSQAIPVAVPNSGLGVSTVSGTNPKEDYGSVNNPTPYKEIKFASVTPIQRLTTDETLFYSNGDHNDLSQFGSMV